LPFILFGTTFEIYLSSINQQILFIMKTSILTLFLSALFVTSVSAQDVTTVNAKSSDISDNLDLRAVASVFGDSENLEDFERRLNDPKNMISNLDLNNDGYVDYLRVVESVEKGTHLIVIQSVLAKDVFQDVATVEVERDSNNNVQVQVVGDVYMYGPNYIYEPVYVHRPVIYSTFWVGSYHPYHSPWYWNYYPVYYTYWAPFPVYQYRRHVYAHINHHHHYNYSSIRRSTRAVALHSQVRANGFERQNPGRSFTDRTSSTNRYAYDQSRGLTDAGTRKGTGVRSNTVSTESGQRSSGIKPAATNTRISSTADNTSRQTSGSLTVRQNDQVSGTRAVTPAKTQTSSTVRSATGSTVVAPKEPATVRSVTPAVRQTTTTRSTTTQTVAPRVTTPATTTRTAPQTRTQAPATQTRTQAPATLRTPAVRSAVRSAEKVNSAPAQTRSAAPRQSSSNNGQRSTRG
jgi:hypothetical protein